LTNKFMLINRDKQDIKRQQQRMSNYHLNRIYCI
ncbi:unnamed protein product, partial [Rotaria sp. Silwood1]